MEEHLICIVIVYADDLQLFGGSEQELRHQWPILYSLWNGHYRIKNAFILGSKFFYCGITLAGFQLAIQNHSVFNQVCDGKMAHLLKTIPIQFLWIERAEQPSTGKYFCTNVLYKIKRKKIILKVRLTECVEKKGIQML